jgi:hypothetical protein
MRAADDVSNGAGAALVSSRDDLAGHPWKRRKPLHFSRLLQNAAVR